MPTCQQSCDAQIDSEFGYGALAQIIATLLVSSCAKAENVDPICCVCKTTDLECKPILRNVRADVPLFPSRERLFHILASLRMGKS